ncbi:hypothetical protein CAEBREN_17397 [Caenorhabditis brenneri]|uniref:Uncharacterized protein n=1 Tax=Caenorhabditis brenneri TaxID=135651 RepID=G0NGI1_CAEBE|nr:hypothetical protein CAEBREN_17397 [Caenorhabditis brenneri]
MDYRNLFAAFVVYPTLINPVGVKEPEIIELIEGPTTPETTWDVEIIFGIFLIVLAVLAILTIACAFVCYRCCCPPRVEMPHQPFFVPYSSQVCPADVQTMEEPSEGSQISSFLYLFVALVLFVNYRRANHRQRPIIIGFLVLLSVNGAVASDASATTEEPGWFMKIINYLYEHPLIIILMGVIAFIVVNAPPTVLRPLFIAANHRQRPIIIGCICLSVFLFVGGVFASAPSATSATSSISTTYEAVKEWAWSFWQDYVLIVNLALIVGMAVLGLVTYTCFVYWQRRRDNRNAVPQLIIGFLVLLSVNGAVASDASATTEEPGWLMTFYRENETVIKPVVIGLVCFALYFVYRERHPQHQVIVQPVAEPERRDWGQRDDDEEEDQV